MVKGIKKWAIAGVFAASAMLAYVSLDTKPPLTKQERFQEKIKSLQKEMDSGNIPTLCYRLRRTSLEKALTNARIPGKPNKFGDVFYVDNQGDLYKTKNSNPLEELVVKGFDITGTSDKFEGFDTLYKTKEGDYFIGYFVPNKYSSIDYHNRHFVLNKNGKMICSSIIIGPIFKKENEFFKSEWEEGKKTLIKIDISNQKLRPGKYSAVLNKKEDGYYAKRNTSK